MTKLRKISVALVLIVLCVITLYLYKDKVVLAHFGSANIYDHHSFELLNPFRDRAAEQSAHTFLQSLRSNCVATLAKISVDPQRVKETCERERLYPLRAWRLHAFQQESHTAVLLRYEVSRSSGDDRGDSDGPFWLWLKRTDGSWQVSGYETWY